MSAIYAAFLKRRWLSQSIAIAALLLSLLAACSQTAAPPARPTPPTSSQTSTPSPTPLPVASMTPSATPQPTQTHPPASPTASPLQVELSPAAEWRLDHFGEAAWAPDSRHLLITDYDLYSADDRTTLYDIESLEPVWQVNRELINAVFSPDGKRIVTGANPVAFWDAETGEPIASYLRGNATYYPVFLPNGAALLIGRVWDYFEEADARTEIGWWNDEEKDLDLIIEERGALASLELSPDGQWLLTALGNVPGSISGRRVFVWDLSTDSKRCDLPGLDAHFHPSGDSLAVATEEGMITLYDTRSCQALRPLGTAEYVSQFAFSPDGKMLAFAGKPSDTIWIHAVSTGEELFQITDLLHITDPLAFSPDGKYLLSSGIEDTKESEPGVRQVIQLWRVAGGSNN